MRTMQARTRTVHVILCRVPKCENDAATGNPAGMCAGHWQWVHPKLRLQLRAAADERLKQLNTDTTAAFLEVLYRATTAVERFEQEEAQLDRQTSECRSCHARIWWGLSRLGKRTPFDVTRGRCTLVSHYTTCPDARRWSADR